jgi:hypothetical protein
VSEQGDVPPGLLVIAGVRTLREADPESGWPAAAAVGALDRRLLLQDKIWIDPHGVIHRLENLGEEHALHVLETLLDMELELEMAARARVGAEMAAGVLDVQTALRDLDAVSALGRRWVEETPLLKRLAALNSVSLPARSSTPFDDPSLPRAGLSAVVQRPSRAAELTDTTGGLWRVSTETSVYLIDLDLRMLLRAPGAVRGTHLNVDGELVRAYEFNTDNAWHKLVRLEVCRLGERMKVRATLGGRDAPIHTTKVTIIELAEPP